MQVCINRFGHQRTFMLDLQGTLLPDISQLRTFARESVRERKLAQLVRIAYRMCGIHPHN